MQKKKELIKIRKLEYVGYIMHAGIYNLLQGILQGKIEVEKKSGKKAHFLVKKLQRTVQLRLH